MADMVRMVGSGVLPGRQAAPVARLPDDSRARKGLPVCTGFLDYFPLAVAEVARLSQAGNDKHNPGEPLHWSRDKSADHADCLGRHLIDRDAIYTDDLGNQFLHATGLAWRAMANLEVTLERMKAAGIVYPPVQPA